MLFVEVRRGPVCESVHRVRACAVRVDGTLVGEASDGDAAWPLYMRSAAKPFQAAPAVAAGVLEELGLDDRHLAVACSSHDGSAEPVAVVREILAAARLDEFAVHTGDDGQGSLVKHQCSGNHALALAFCVVAGWSTDGYLEPDHPVQRTMNAAVDAACGVEAGHAADNCGMTTHRVPLAAMARAFARLGTGSGEIPGLDRVAGAMRAHPGLAGRAGAIDRSLLELGGDLVAKIAAEAGVGIGSGSGLGVAVRIEDGSPRAWGPATIAALRRWIGDPDHPVWRDPELGRVGEPVLLDGAARPIGSMVAVWR